jgi:predicted small metal-binding protein
MPRVMIDCGRMPSESGCTLRISGEEDEVVRAAAAHAVEVHGHTDGDELRAGLRAALTPEQAELTAAQGGFVQVIEFRTDRIEEFEQIEDRWVEAIGKDTTAQWAITGADRTRPGHYLQVVGFPSYDAAMANSKHPATDRFSRMLAEICDGEAVFHDLDVRRVQSL